MKSNLSQKPAAEKEKKEDAKTMLLHLESEYRKASISEKNYKELKGKYLKMLGETDDAKKEAKKTAPKEIPKAKPIVSEPKAEPVEEEEPEEVESEEAEEVSEEDKSVDDELKKVEEQAEKEIVKPEKKGIFKSLFGKKAEAQKEAPAEADPPKQDAPKAPKKQKEEEITEITPEVIERLAKQAAMEQSEEGSEQQAEEGKKSGGFLKSIFKKKDSKNEPQPEQQAPQQAQAPQEQPQEQPESAERYKPAGIDYGVEIEKLKVMIDSVRESGKLTDESVRNLSENLGEVRSMVFQTDADLKEGAVKMEKIDDDISEVKPDEIAKKLREIDETFGKQQLEMEKLGRKAEDAGEKINKVFEILKSIGGIENLVNINTDIQKKLNDINEAMKYVERIGMKTEKMFIDLNKGLQDLVIIRSQQDDFNESMKDIIKNIDSVNVKFEGYMSKKELESFKEEILLIKKETEGMKKILPIADLKLPEEIVNLRKEREDIKMLLDSLQDQLDMRKISKQDYESVRNANMKRLEEIGSSLDAEWKKVEYLLKPDKGGAEGVEEEIETKPQKTEEKIEDERKKEKHEKFEELPKEEAESQEESEETEAPEEKIEEEPKAEEPEPEEEQPVEVNPPEEAKPVKTVKPAKPSKKKPKAKASKTSKTNGSERARKLQILRDIKKMH